MKRITFTILFLLVSAVSAEAYVSFTWDPGPIDATHDPATSYTVKCGNAAGGPYPIARSVVAPATSLSFSQEITLPGTYFCVVTATNNGGESGPSVEITFRYAPPTPPVNFKVN